MNYKKIKNISVFFLCGILYFSLANAFEKEQKNENKIQNETTPIRAFIRVVKLACLVDNQLQGAEIQVANVTGGTSNQYEYKYGNGAWVTSNMGVLLPGVHRVFIRNIGDASTEIQQEITVANPVETPTFQVQQIQYNCQTNQGKVKIIPSDIVNYEFPNLQKEYEFSQGIHQISIAYQYKNNSEYNLLIQEDFGTGGNVSNSEIEALGYTYKNITPFLWLEDGEYCITNDLTDRHVPIYWTSPNDHTGLLNGRYLAMNLGDVAGHGGVIYRKKVQDVIPNRPIKFELFVFNLMKTAQGMPDIGIELVDNQGNVIDSYRKGQIPPNKGKDDWQRISSEESKKLLNPKNNTSFWINIRTYSTEFNGNDLAIDDIRVYQEQEGCSGTKEVSVVVDRGEEVVFEDKEVVKNAKCSGRILGSYQIDVKDYNSEKEYFYRIYNENEKPENHSFQKLENKRLFIQNLEKGNYFLEVKTTGCATTKKIKIDEEISQQIVDFQKKEMLCNEQTGGISFSVKDGKSPYSYKIFRQEDNSVLKQGEILHANVKTQVTEIESGYHLLEIRDADNCIVSQGFVLENPLKLPSVSLLPKCGELSDIRIDLQESEYWNELSVWVNGKAVQTPSKIISQSAENKISSFLLEGIFISEGINQVRIAKKMCEYTLLIEKPKMLDFELIRVENDQVEFEITNGIAPFSYAVFQEGKSVEENGFISQKNEKIKLNLLNNGAYILEIRDNLGCVLRKNFQINLPLEKPFLKVVPNCISERYTIEMELKSPEIWESLSFFIDENPIEILPIITNLKSVWENVVLANGTHSFKVKKANFEQIVPFEVTSPLPLQMVNKTENSELNKLTIAVQGGKAPYRVSFLSDFQKDTKLDCGSDFQNLQENELLSFELTQGQFAFWKNGKEMRKILVCVEDALGCFLSQVVELQYFDIEIPKVFTPNGDGKNDYWSPKNLTNYKHSVTKIFDRYGRLLATLNYNQQWDGKYKEKELPSGDYWYILEVNHANDTRAFSGHFTLYR